jgi:hypothetical protein
MLKVVLVEDGKRNTQREQARENERSGRECETSFIIFSTWYIHASSSTE